MIVRKYDRAEQRQKAIIAEDKASDAYRSARGTKEKQAALKQLEEAQRILAEEEEQFQAFLAEMRADVDQTLATARNIEKPKPKELTDLERVKERISTARKTLGELRVQNKELHAALKENVAAKKRLNYTILPPLVEAKKRLQGGAE